jgi:hemolysin III
MPILSKSAVAELECRDRDLAGYEPSEIDSPATAEIANSITHGLGLVFSVLAGIVLLIAVRHADFWRLAACAIYSATMIAVYVASACSHIFSRPRARQFFRMLDQGCIYLFIAGSFTPVVAAYLRDGWWLMLLAAMWLVALVGFFSKIVLVHRIENVSTAIPVILGWMPLLGGRAMLDAIPAGLVWWMLAGGLCYTLGTLFLISDHRHRYLHAVWHLWVIAGTACQFWAIYHYVGTV